MKRQILLTIIGILILTIATWAIFFTYDLINYKKGNPPLIVFKENIDTYEDGIVLEYYSFGYVVRFYDREIINENDLTLSFNPQKFKYLSIGTVNDISKLIEDKELTKGNFIKMHGKYNDELEDASMQTYSYTITVNDKLKTESELIFDENYIYICENKTNEKIKLENTSDYILQGQIKKISIQGTTTKITLDYCYFSVE